MKRRLHTISYEMVIRTIFTFVIRFFRSICAAFLLVSSPSRTTTSDVESGLPGKTSGGADVGMVSSFFLCRL